MNTLEQARADHEIAKLQAETLELQQITKSLETASRVVESEWGEMVDRREYLYDTPGFGSPFNSRATTSYDRNRGQLHPFFDNEQDLAQIRGIARFCAGSYETGINAMENLVSFVLGKGFVYDAVPRSKEDGAPEPLLKAVNKAIQEFHEANAWEGDLETELVMRSDRDGESFVWMRDDEGPMCSIIEPDYITEPAEYARLNDKIECHDADWFLGVAASPMHLDCAKGYFAQWPHGALGMIPHSRMTHIKCNVDRMVKRGLSSFYPVWQTLEKAAKLNDRTIHGSTIQASIALIKKSLTGTTQNTLEQGRTGRAFATNSYGTQRGTRTDYYEDWSKAGKIIGTAGVEYQAGPLGQSGAPTYMDVVGAALRIVGTRWQMPEYMISGDSSNANYASTLVSGGPFDRATSRRQAFYRRKFLAIHWQALDIWCKGGRFRQHGINTLNELKSVIDIQVDCEPASMNDPQVQHTINKDLQTAGVMSKATFADRNGLDYDAEQEKIESEPKPEPLQGMPGVNPAMAGNPLDGDKDGTFPESLREAEAKDGDGDGLINDGKPNEQAVMGGKHPDQWSRKEVASMSDADLSRYEDEAWQRTKDITQKYIASNEASININIDPKKLEREMATGKPFTLLYALTIPDDKLPIQKHANAINKLLPKRDKRLFGGVSDETVSNAFERLAYKRLPDSYKSKLELFSKGGELFVRTKGSNVVESTESRLAEAARLIWGDYAGGRPLVEAAEPKDGDGDGLVNDGKANEGPVGAVTKKNAKPKALVLDYRVKDPRNNINKKEATESLNEMLPGWKPHEAASLFGAEADDVTATYAAVKLKSGNVAVEFKLDDWAEGASSERSVLHRTIFRTKKGELICKNDLFLSAGHPPGYGAKTFSGQVEHMSEAGFSEIRTNAARWNSDGEDHYVGYKVWPKMGYDGPLPAESLKKLPDSLKGAKTIQQLYKTKAGMEWWEKNGTDISLKFDLSDGSRSKQLLGKYLEKKRAATKVSESKESTRADNPLSAEDELVLDEMWKEIHEGK